MNFNNLLTTITDIQNFLQYQAIRSVNQVLTIRNWLIGFYITEYEQNGEDRAEYGKQLLKHLSAKLISMKIKGMSYRNLRLFRQFYQTYPQIWQSVNAKFDFNDNLLNNLPMSQLQKKYNNVSYSPSPELTYRTFF
ncbi:DUF1016 [Desulfonema limicola]|uniref:DUF1016 n=1 Tax=Desulfonema limicola TaxID=45656 RepID=A0A975BBL9_9BACT|nr:DUF1016 N-terminal domain-containing protein [Desulfonema limicola]QTA82382.1 DUF1016 [Desulfonema limicola]